MRLFPISLIFSLFITTSASAVEKAIVDSTHVSKYIQPVSITDSIIDFGKIFLKTPYHYGGNGPSGFDCSGFTSHVYSNFGINLQRSSADQAKQFPNPSRHNLQAGDLVFFEGRRRNGRVGHVGIVVDANPTGDFNFIHSATSSGVIISNSNEKYYKNRFVSAGRVLHNDSLLAHAANTKYSAPSANTAFVSTQRTEIVKRTIAATYHTVRAGENLSVIAKKYGLSVNELKRNNDLKRSNLNVNQQLCITNEQVVSELVPIKNTHEMAEVDNQTQDKANDDNNNNNLATNNLQSESPKTHRVKAGETLFSIARQYHTTVTALKAANNTTSNQVNAGQEINIGTEPSTTVAQADIAPNAMAKNNATTQEMNFANLTHKVKKGETLTEIGRKYNISVEELKQINRLSKNTLVAGQELLVTEALATIETPANGQKPTNTKVETAASTASAATQHRVNAGETLASIAKMYNTSIAKIKSDNNLQQDNIKAGEQLQITSSSARNLATATPTNDGTQIAIGTQKYKIEKGETLLTIAQKHNMKLDELRKMNPLNSDKIKAGDELNVRANTLQANAKVQYHEVAPGDSFYNIAKKYGCTIDELMKWNNKTSARLNAGEKLLVYPKV